MVHFDQEFKRKVRNLLLILKVIMLPEERNATKDYFNIYVGSFFYQAS